MGWMILLAFRQFLQAVPPQTVAWLLAGGVAYTSGLIFFGNKRVRYSHFIWHLFVLAGTACHFCAILSCVA
jgi:hemolysin III